VPVPPELRPGARAILVGEGPGEGEVKAGVPFVGPSGIELERALAAVGIRRRDVSITNSVLCPLPGFSMTQARAEHAKENRARVKRGEPAQKAAVECCAPRLRRDLSESNGNVITLGGTALGAVGVSGSVLELRGGPREVPFGDARSLRVLPTLHPAFVLRARRWTRAFTSDLGRAFRWFGSGLAWTEPEILYNPTAAELTAWLEAERSPITYDVETLPGFSDAAGNEHFDPLYDRLTYVGLASADGKRAVGIPFYSFDRNAIFSPPSHLKPVIEVLKAFFVSPRWLKTGWNEGYYDVQVIRHWFKVMVAPHRDGIGLHKMAEPELPHRLGYAGSIYTDAPSWKDEFAAAPTDDASMKVYNARDCAITAITVPQLARAVVARGQERAAHFWPFVQSVCVDLHTNGMRVDQRRREEWDVQLRRDAREKLKVIRDLTGLRTLNPNSPLQLRDLFFDTWGLQPWGDPTEGGDPSTGDDTLRAFLSPSYDLDAPKKEIVRAIRRFRVFTKKRGTYVVKLRPWGAPLTDAEMAFDAEEGDEERTKRLKSSSKPGLVLPDGRVHGDYLPHGTVGWRLSSSKPNCFDAATSVLTPDGWVLIGELKRGVKVAEWSAGTIHFVDPTAYYTETAAAMVTMRNQHIDLRLTPDHRCVLRHRKTGQLHVFTAREYPSDWEQIHAGRYIEGRGLGIDSDEMIVLCATQADGSWDRGGITFGFARPRKIDRLVGALTRLGVPFSRGAKTIRDTPFKRGAETTRIRIGDCWLTEKIRVLIGVEKVFRWPMLFAMTSMQIREFVAECYLWDGSETRRNCYSSSIERNAEVFQAAVALTGQRAHFRVYVPKSGRPNYQIDVTDRDYSLTTNVEKKIAEADEPVYCISVPSSYLLVRRGGEIHVTGQCQNFPDDLRDMIIPEEGYVFVGCDEAQLELRMVAALSGARVYLDAFNAGTDPHLVLCHDFFGNEFEQASKDGRKDLRRFVKEFTYASAYRAGAETVHAVLTSSEDKKTGRLLYPDLALRETIAFHTKWLARNPEIERWWEADLVEFRRQHYLAEPIFGLRRDFLDGEEPNEIANYKAQSGGSALVHLATEIIMRELPKYGARLVQQGHDSLVSEVPADHARYIGDGAEFGYCPPGCGCRANKVARMKEEAMTVDGAKWGLPVRFAGESKIGTNWKEV
jgi:DNA polymerase